MRLRRLILLGFCILSGIPAIGSPVHAAAPALRIKVLRGSSSNNNMATGGSVSPAVLVMNALGKPVEGALVIFMAPSTGSSVDFSGTGPLVSVQTDETGTEVAPRIRPVGGNGPVEISVLAEKNGISANVSIYQMNLGLKIDPGPAPQELDLVIIPVSAATHHDQARKVLLRVQDATGQPRAGARVECSWRSHSGSRSGEFGRPYVTTSNAGGDATCEMDSKSARSRRDSRPEHSRMAWPPPGPHD